MAVEIKDLLRDLQENYSRVTVSRLKYLTRQATDEEVVEFINGLIVKAGEAKYMGSWQEMEEYLDHWESLMVARLASNMKFPDSSGVPWTPLAKPISQCRIALVTTGGIYTDGQPAFEAADDVSFREIGKGTPQSGIHVSHRGYDTTGPQEDVNCVLPLHRFEELEGEGVIGSLAEVSYSFMGLIRDATTLKDSSEKVAQKLKADGIDAVFLTAT